MTRGQLIKFTTHADSTDPQQPIIPQLILSSLHKDNSILIDDGLGEFIVEEIGPDFLTARAQSDFSVKDRKTLNTPGVILDMPSLIDRNKPILHVDGDADERCRADTNTHYPGANQLM